MCRIIGGGAKQVVEEFGCKRYGKHKLRERCANKTNEYTRKCDAEGAVGALGKEAGKSGRHGFYDDVRYAAQCSRSKMSRCDRMAIVGDQVKRMTSHGSDSDGIGGQGAHGQHGVSATVRVSMAIGRDMLQLRGGGPQLRRTVNSCGRLLGAGIIDWLEDSDYEAEEVAELQRRQCEIDINDGTPPECQAAEHEGADGPRPARPITVIGERDGRRTYVCTACGADTYIDHDHDGWQHAASWRCQKCGPRPATITESVASVDAAAKTIICIADALDRQGRVTISLAHELGDDPTQCGNNLTPQDLTTMQTTLSSQSPIQNSGQRNLAAIQCSACGLIDSSMCSEWRICRCGNTLCVLCAMRPCPDCPAINAWGLGEQRDEGNGQQQAQTVPHLQFTVTMNTPEAAQEKRVQDLKDIRAQLEARRQQSRGVRRRQLAANLRPSRTKPKPGTTRFVTANVNSASRAQEEIEHGRLFGTADVVCIQEHKARGQPRERMATWLRRRDWDSVSQDAYIKTKREGGGTAVIARGENLRPLGNVPTELEGRCTLAIAQGEGEYVSGSFYGISGAKVKQQIRGWNLLAARLRAIGLPFVIGGDWQVDPTDMASTRIDELLDAEIIAPREATNIKSGNVLDYYIVSRSLTRDNWDIHVSAECSFSPHHPVVLDLPIIRPKGDSCRLLIPRALPVYVPTGPSLPRQHFVDWDKWETGQKLSQSKECNAAELDNAVSTWYAGAEAELLDIMGLHGADAEAYRGIGLPPRVAQHTAECRFRDVPDEVGLLGQRIAWTAKGVHIVIFLRDCPAGERKDRLYDTLCSTSRRARAINQDMMRRPFSDNEKEWKDMVQSGLAFLSNLTRWHHGRIPGAARVYGGGGEDVVIAAAELEHSLAKAAEDIATRRRRTQTRACRTWAKAATLAASHRATKLGEHVTVKTASASKKHEGETTSQRAADHGLSEWAPIWDGSPTDSGEKIARTIEAIYAIGRKEDEEEELLLPPISPERVAYISAKFKGSAGRGCDGMRPHHYKLLTAKAKCALIMLFDAFERFRRWPDTIRSVVEIALGKKTGGSRLIGLTTSMYRLWSKIRYSDCCFIIERRISRPYLPAAPGRGAARATFDAAFAAEAATARGEVTATTCFDLKQYYEQITMEELAHGAKRFGVPQAVIVLAIHLYSGPRRIRVNNAISKCTYPRKSVLAGCTFATMLIRMISIGPIDVFLDVVKRRLRGWGAKADFNLYVDDGAVSTIGDSRAVQLLHPWVSKIAFDWTRKVLRKQVAPNKTTCITSTRALKDAIKDEMATIGATIHLEGELLGTDYTAGGKLRRRRIQNRRRMNANKRRSRLQWLRRIGGRAREVARGGITAEATYGDMIYGMTGGALRDVRATHAAAVPVRVTGASLTAKLALGGPGYSEFDPAVLRPNPPLAAVLNKLWDHPQSRSDFIRSWRQAGEEIEAATPAGRWTSIRGPVGAAMAHLLRVQGAWPRPFTLHLLDHDVDILTVTPIHIMEIMAAHARRHYDRAMIDRMCTEHGWDKDEVSREYAKGVDWDIIRNLLREENGALGPREKRAIFITACGGFWPEARRWQHGIIESAECEACKDPQATALHRIHECDAMAFDRVMWQVGQRAHKMEASLRAASFAPLLNLGLPPVAVEWAPMEVRLTEGGISMGGSAIGYDEIFGDGSGYRQQTRQCRIATWSIVRKDLHSTRGHDGFQRKRGAVGGWHPTVPRAELSALVEFLMHAGPDEAFISDCSYVVEGARHGVLRKLTASTSANADLWREARRLEIDRGALTGIFKTKAHRSKAEALQDGKDPIRWWLGNHEADSAAKDLAQKMATSDGRMYELEAARAQYRNAIIWTAMGAAWAYQRWPASGGPRAAPDADDDVYDEIHPDDRHILYRGEGNRLECRRCRKYAISSSGMAKMLKGTCSGSTLDLVHPSHAVRQTAGVIWCTRCGSYASRQPRRLAQICDQRPRTEPQRNVLRRLAMNLPPTTAKYLEDVAIASGGLRGADNSHAEEVAWRNGTGGESRRGDGHRTNQEIMTRLAKAPSGRYARLPGGYLYQPSATSRSNSGEEADPRIGIQMNGDTATQHPSVNEQAPNPAPPPPVGERERQRGNIDACVNTSTGAWTRRFATRHTACAKQCNSCSSPTRTLCRGCERPLCILCARSRVTCPSPAMASTSSSSAGEKGQSRELIPT